MLRGSCTGRLAARREPHLFLALVLQQVLVLGREILLLPKLVGVQEVKEGPERVQWQAENGMQCTQITQCSFFFYNTPLLRGGHYDTILPLSWW